ncbi:MAG: hypothetical protein BWK80_34130 [Desulfobacteraceae bacterium IS3]|nr:MAG: hypothetical protein BWK80_34130 [Desulfobacteraceae bacterium IS3]
MSASPFRRRITKLTGFVCLCLSLLRDESLSSNISRSFASNSFTFPSSICSSRFFDIQSVERPRLKTDKPVLPGNKKISLFVRSPGWGKFFNCHKSSEPQEFKLWGNLSASAGGIFLKTEWCKNIP